MRKKLNDIGFNAKKINLSVEEYCLKFAIDFYHLASLLWVRSERTTTKEYVIHLYGNLMDTFLSMCHLADYKVKDREMDKAYEAIQKVVGKNYDMALLGFGAEIQNDSTTDLITKLAGIFYVAEAKLGLTWGDVITNSKIEK